MSRRGSASATLGRPDGEGLAPWPGYPWGVVVAGILGLVAAYLLSMGCLMLYGSKGLAEISKPTLQTLRNDPDADLVQVAALPTGDVAVSGSFLSGDVSTTPNRAAR